MVPPIMLPFMPKMYRYCLFPPVPIPITTLPGDQLSAINLEGAREVIAFVSEMAAALANQHERIAFTEAGPKVQGSSRGRRGGITLGLMPDMTYDGNEGMPVMFVTEGKPAAVGGIQKGDIIVAIEGKSVGNVYDYMSPAGWLERRACPLWYGETGRRPHRPGNSNLITNKYSIMKSKKVLFWVLAVVISLAAMFYQRMTGPTYPKKYEISYQNEDI